MMKLSRFRNFANAPKNDDNGWSSQNVFSVSTIMTDSQMKTSYPVSHYTVLSDVTELHAGTLPKTYGSLKCLRADLRLPPSPKVKKKDAVESELLASQFTDLPRLSGEEGNAGYSP
jgi:hypothetical protein